MVYVANVSVLSIGKLEGAAEPVGRHSVFFVQTAIWQEILCPVTPFSHSSGITENRKIISGNAL